MSRKQIRSHAKKTSKKANPQTKKPTLLLAEVMEKDFRRIPLELPAQYGKDILSLKQHEKKLSAKLKKMQIQKKAAKNKHTDLIDKSKKNLTPSVKNKLRVMKDGYTQINQEINELNNQLTEIKHRKKFLSLKQAKFTTLSKHITKLDRLLEAKVLQLTQVKKTKKVPKKLDKKAQKITTPGLSPQGQSQLITPNESAEPHSTVNELELEEVK